MFRFLLLLFLVACQGKEGRAIDQSTTGTGGSAATSAGPAPSLTDSYDKALVDLEALKSKMCACTDVVCTDKVFAEFTAWRMELKKSNAGKKPTPDQDKKGNALDRAMKQCRAQVAADVAKKDSGVLSGSAAGNPVDAALAEMETWKTKMCECRDKACADKLQAEFATWQRLLRAKMTEKPTTLQEVRGNAIDKEMKECRKKAEAGTPGAPNVTSKIDNMLTEMQTFRDKICACTTKACGDGVGKEMEAWQTKVGKELADAKPTKDQDDKADRLAAEMKTCLGKLK